MRRCNIAVLLFVILIPTFSSGAVPADPVVVSLIQLIATTEKFDGKLITATGFLRLEHEGYLLYLGKDDYENVMLENALWVDATEEIGKNKAQLELKYVRIVGTFRAGHEKRNLFSPGGITDITSCKFWSDPAHPLEERIRAMHK